MSNQRRHSELWARVESVTETLGYVAAIERRWGEVWVNVGDTAERDYVVTDLRSSMCSYGPYETVEQARHAMPGIRADLDRVSQA